ncbi:MAG TPA: MIP family channel protein [Phycisphaerae bacterium]|nr:MIP family channel protein [Phycisphaerae bacterium]
MTTSRTVRECLAEFIGTGILVFFGIGAVHVVILTGALTGLGQVAMVWGIAISLAIYATGAVSGAHINPAVTLAFAAFRGFPLRKVGPYVVSQMAGAFAAAALLYGLYGGAIAEFESANGLVRGGPGSERSAMVYGEYFPNPAVADALPGRLADVTQARAMLAEGAGTALLAFFVFAVTDRRNTGRPRGTMFALFIGLAVAIIIAIIAPLTQAGLNPARDFAPRLLAYLAGWGPVAIPGPRGGFFTVYILSPVLGALAGGAAYQYVLRPAMPRGERHASHVSERQEIPMHATRLILVGGFLGAGKTTLLARAAERLVGEGRRVGLITNDQARNLVDTAVLRGNGYRVQEVAGGCFCCRIGDLLTAADRLLAEQRPDVLIGEPVGSCTDISATVLQPIKKLHGDRFRLAPFSVVVDPVRLRQALGDGAAGAFPESVLYIFRKQIEEADLILLNKSDLVSAAELGDLRAMLDREFPGRAVMVLSAATGAGVDEWLQAVRGDAPAGRRIAQVDYDTYAEGEAVLGWLNADVGLGADRPADWAAFCRRLLDGVRAACRARAAEVAHVKLLLTAPGCNLVGNLAGNDAPALVRGKAAVSAGEAHLLVNARVHMPPDDLRHIVEACIGKTADGRLRVRMQSLESFSPARPQPVHRFSEVV